MTLQLGHKSKEKTREEVIQQLTKYSVKNRKIGMALGVLPKNDMKREASAILKTEGDIAFMCRKFVLAKKCYVVAAFGDIQETLL